MTGSSVSIGPAAPHLPDGVGPLAERARAEGIRIVDRVVGAWRDGTEVFDRPGEVLLVAVAAGDEVADDGADDGAGDDGAAAGATARVVAIGGITVCPTVPGALRVRRFYVHPDHRRRGLARRLATRLLDEAATHTDRITCNAGASDAAAPFWESLGFEPVDHPGITHERRSADPSI